MGLRKFLDRASKLIGEEQPDCVTDAYSYIVCNPKSEVQYAPVCSTNAYTIHSTGTYVIPTMMEVDMTSSYLKAMNVRVAQMEDLMLARDALAHLEESYARTGIETPEWVVDRKMDIDNEIIHRRRAELTKRLKVARAKREDLATPEEKREKLDKEIADLENRPIRSAFVKGHSRYKVEE